MPAPRKPDLQLFGSKRAPVVPFKAGAATPTMTPTRMVYKSADRSGRAAITAALDDNTYSISDFISIPYSGSFTLLIDTLPGAPLDLFTITKSVGFTLEFTITLNTDGTISFFVEDSGGTAEIRTTAALVTGFAYQIAFSYSYDGSIANKEDFMFLWLNGRLASTSTITSDPAVDTLSTLVAALLSFDATGIRLAAFSFFYFFVWSSAFAWWSWWVYWYWWYYYWWYWYYWWFMWYWWYWWAIASGDPHFVGSEGENFFFNGEVDKYYNLLSDKNLQINAFFRYWETSGDEGLTAIENIGVQSGRNKILINANQPSTVNNLEIKEKMYFKEEDEYYGTISPIDKLPGEVAKKAKDLEGFGDFCGGYLIETKYYKIFIAICTDNVNPRFLNFIGQTKNKEVRPHGIIGQTADFDGKPRIQNENTIQGEGVIDGEYKDYEVSSLWNSDFKFNKYKPKLY